MHVLVSEHKEEFFRRSKSESRNGDRVRALPVNSNWSEDVQMNTVKHVMYYG